MIINHPTKKMSNYSTQIPPLHLSKVKVRITEEKNKTIVYDEAINEEKNLDNCWVNWRPI